MKRSEDFTAVVLAAGKGTRMKSSLPKVLHPVAGWPMILNCIDCVQEAGAKEVRVVVGYGEKLVRQMIEPRGVLSFKQEQQKGTGHAVMCAGVNDISGTVVILNGDHPLLYAQDIVKIVKEYNSSRFDLAVVTSVVKKPGSLGRVVRHEGKLKAIVEVKDASHQTLKITEVNTGMYITDAKVLSELLPKIGQSNVQNEFYLTDIISLASENGYESGAILASPRAAFGVNSQCELARATQYIFNKKCNELMEEGVIIVDPKNTYIEKDVSIGAGTVINPGCHIKNKTKIDKFCVIEPNCFIDRSVIGEGVQIKAGSYIENSEVKSKAVVGPYARIRPGSKIGKEAKVGNFVELKKVDFGDRAKASHLTYLGDAIIGEDTNIGCGTITCNYAFDKKKYVTKIGKNVFVGSDSQFVAPVEIGDDAFVASGSTVTKDVPAGGLAVARSRQFNKENYKPKLNESVSSEGKSDQKKRPTAEG